jgi:maleate isomerase
LICPYPHWLLTAAEAHWRGRGFQVADHYSLEPNQGDTRAIYALSPARAAEQIKSRWQNCEADAYLITGTGLPTLQAVADLAMVLSAPVLSSNLCLAWATLQAAGVDRAELSPTPQMPLLAGWGHRVGRL